MGTLSKDDLMHAFRECGMTPGDTLMLHADALVLAQLPPMAARLRYDMLFAAIDDVLGPTGTLIMPVFTYSFTKGETFDVDNTPSTVGALTEHFRSLPGVLRSRDPIFSIAARGFLAEIFAAAAIDDCFGPQSSFALLERHNGKIACMGTPFTVTFAHYVEQIAQVDYRYFKKFSGTVVDKGREEKTTVRYFVRCLERQSDIDLSILKARLIKRKQLASVPVGRVALSVVSCRSFADEAVALIAERPNGLIVEGAQL